MCVKSAVVVPVVACAETVKKAGPYFVKSDIIKPRYPIEPSPPT